MAAKIINLSEFRSERSCQRSFAAFAASMAHLARVYNALPYGEQMDFLARLEARDPRDGGPNAG